MKSFFSQDIIYHNEAYTNSDDSSPETENKSIINASTPPQRNHSFIAAVFNAIKSAASTAKSKVHTQSVSHEKADVTEMLDSETEPCLMMENVLEDVSMPDSHSQNLISSSILSSVHDLDDNQDDSLHSLCEAIANRQKIEEQTTLMMMKSMNNDRKIDDKKAMISEGLVDHIINVDNLVTKLLKILRIIQIDNDNCIQQIINEK